MLRKLICFKCYSSSSEYNLKYRIKYILEYCTVKLNVNLRNIYLMFNKY
jgi:hypothetical protein